MEKNKIEMINDKGEKLNVRVLFTVEDAKTLKNYIVYTNDEKDSTGKIKTYASLYKESKENGKFDLFPITTDEEYDFISKMLSSLSEKEGKKNEEEV
ncbi:MAG: DUF1292 domain-containing protein [Bacilli bacterium]|nr:DUF1292 domain-containing protein [Bacilli bacterium]